MKKKFVYPTVILFLIFIGTNLYLIEKADSKVDRTSFVHSWNPISTSSLRNTLEKEAILSSAEENYVYFDDSYGRFKDFLVKEGDEVSIGTDLFTYQTEDTDNQEAFLESEIEKLEDEIDSIESHIIDLRAMRPDSSTTGNTNYYDDRYGLPSTTEDDDEDLTLKASNQEINYYIDQEIAEKELEIDQLNHEVDNLDRQLSQLQLNESEVTVASTAEGTVKKVSRELDNPVIVISSRSTVVEGELSEQETLKIKEGQEAIVYSPAVKDALNGFVTDVAVLPSETLTEDGLSAYPFKVEFGEENENLDVLRPGFHVSLSIITEEAKDVLTVPEESLIKEGIKDYLLLVTEKGTLEKREVTIGMTSEGRAEIQQGVKKNDIYVRNPDSMDLAGSTFVTPLNINRLTVQAIKNADNHTILENILLGILERK
ncbi:efflux RND transporter periplasmic adaptor subunit [Bacillus sp. SCS-153A]|uniref:efflux RND transporter periplasmic adaptor subunit n=1 Tax=Rossellomorea sedimentorum TaxID=3115294 RepID=UPI003906527E